MSESPDEPQERQLSRNEETIRRWAKEHDVVPVETDGPEQYRLVPEDEVSNTDEGVGWGRFAEELEQQDFVVAYYGESTSDPFEIQGQSELTADLDDEEIEERLLEGKTVTSTVTETAVVETVVVEELDVESELVDSEIIDEESINIELQNRECLNCTYRSVEDTDESEWFDTDRYFASLRGEMAGTESAKTESTEVPEGFPYHIESDVEETWRVTREFTEQYVVESEIMESDVSEVETIEDYDIDMSGLHNSIVSSGIIEEGLDPEDAMTNYDIQSELTEEGRIHTTFSRHRTVEDEILDRKRITAAPTASESIEMEILATETTTTGEKVPGSASAESAEFTDAGEETTAEEGVGDPTAEETTASGGGDEPPTEEPATDVEAGASASATPQMTDDLIGQRVIDATGEEVGMVSDVQEDKNMMYVDVDPGIADRIQAALGWGDADEEDYHLDAGQINQITGDTIELKQPEDI